MATTPTDYSDTWNEGDWTPGAFTQDMVKDPLTGQLINRRAYWIKYTSPEEKARQQSETELRQENMAVLRGIPNFPVTPITSGDSTSTNYLQLTESIYPNFPPDILNLFAKEWAKTGNPNVAMGNVRKLPEYEIAFPGNKRPDGTVKFDEVTYAGLKESYIGTLAEYGIPRDTSVNLLSDRLTGLIEGEVSAREFKQRIDAVYQGIQENIPQVQEFYSTNYGLELSPEAIFMGALDPTIGEEIVAGKITTAQIGGEASKAGFNIDLSTAEKLKRAGLNQTQARQFFSVAADQLPRIQELQQRGGRAVPQEEVFDLEKFTEAMLYQSPDEAEELRRLEAEEVSRFSAIGGAARTGGRVTGLTEN